MIRFASAETDDVWPNISIVDVQTRAERKRDELGGGRALKNLTSPYNSAI